MQKIKQTVRQEYTNIKKEKNAVAADEMIETESTATETVDNEEKTKKHLLLMKQWIM